MTDYIDMYGETQPRVMGGYIKNTSKLKFC